MAHYDLPKELFAKSAQTPVDELWCRRPGWTRGLPVRLADGSLWSIPKLDVVILITVPEMCADLTRAFDLADEIDREEEDGKEHAVKVLRHHAHLANIGVRLLQLNYDLPDEAWNGLLNFMDLSAMLELTVVVAGVVIDTIALWMPFVLVEGADGADNLRLN